MTRTLPHLDHVEAVHVRVPFRRPFVTARGTITHRDSWILRLRDVDGREGFGEIALDPAASGPELARQGQAVRQAVAMLASGVLPEASPSLRAGIEAALESIEATADRRLSVPVNATLDWASPQETAETAVRAVDAGFDCLKLKVGPEAQAVALAGRVRAVRDAVGPAVRLRLDVNGSWDLQGAIERLTALAGFDIEYVEQPLPPGDLPGHAVLRRACSVPVALDESVESEDAVARILVAEAADVLVVKPARVGGPGVVRAIGALAEAVGVPLVVSTFFETGIGTYAALRVAAELPIVGAERAHGLATTELLEHDLLAEPLCVASGRIEVPPKLVVEEHALQRFTMERVGDPA